MSASLWDWPLASADGLLTNEECSMLLDIDFLENDDVLKSFPHAAPKIVGELLPLDYQVDDASTLYPVSAPASPREAKPSRAQLASDLLQQLDNQCKQENLFSNWLEEKVDLPIFDNVCPERADGAPLAGAPLAAPVLLPPPASTHAAHAAHAAPVATEELLREFEVVYGAVELTHLTPPQSPPGPATQLLLSYAQQAAPAPAPAAWPAHDLDELVRCRASQLASPPPSAASDVSSPLSSPRSSHSSHSSGDEDWSLGAASSRGKPYARQPDERRSRKKEQNKNAATRYRQKKKAEVEVLLGEEAAMRARRAELGSKCADVQREVRYLKGLMRDLFKAKGLIK